VLDGDRLDRPNLRAALGDPQRRLTGFADFDVRFVDAARHDNGLIRWLRRTSQRITR